MKFNALGLVLIGITACAQQQNSEAPVAVAMDGSDITLDGSASLRALRLELDWAPGVQVTAITAGKDAARLNLVRSRIGTTTATVLLADSRRLQLPKRGRILHLEASGPVRVISAVGADDRPAVVAVSVLR